ncbi:hypothetical protein FKM82_003768 [Ascaphus truei]
MAMKVLKVRAPCQRLHRGPAPSAPCASPTAGTCSNHYVTSSPRAVTAAFLCPVRHVTGVIYRSESHLGGGAVCPSGCGSPQVEGKGVEAPSATAKLALSRAQTGRF